MSSSTLQNAIYCILTLSSVMSQLVPTIHCCGSKQTCQPGSDISTLFCVVDMIQWSLLNISLCICILLNVAFRNWPHLIKGLGFLASWLLGVLLVNTRLPLCVKRLRTGLLLILPFSLQLIWTDSSHWNSVYIINHQLVIVTDGYWWLLISLMKRCS